MYAAADWRGRPFFVRHDSDTATREGRPVVTEGDTFVGQVPVPNPVQGWLRGDLTAALEHFLSRTLAWSLGRNPVTADRAGVGGRGPDFRSGGSPEVRRA